MKKFIILTSLIISTVSFAEVNIIDPVYQHMSLEKSYSQDELITLFGETSQTSGRFSPITGENVDRDIR